MLTHREPSFFRDILVRAKMSHSKPKFSKVCNKPNSCQHYESSRYLDTWKLSDSELIYCLEYNICTIKYTRQTRNRVIDRFMVISLISNIIIIPQWLDAASYKCSTNPRITIHILEYVRLPKDIHRPYSLRDQRELIWSHGLNTLIPDGLVS